MADNLNYVSLNRFASLMLSGGIDPNVYYFTHPRIWIRKNWVVSRPTLISGYPGLGRIGEVVLRFLVRELSAKQIGIVTSPYFSSQAVVGKDGIARLTAVRLYLKPRPDGDLVLALGEQHQEMMGGEYETCRVLLSFFKKVGGTKVITVGGHMEPPRENLRTYVFTSDARMAAQLKTDGFTMAPAGTPIVGAAGIALGLSRLLGLQGVGVLGLTNSEGPDLEAAKHVLVNVDTLLKLGLNFSKFEAETDRWRELQEQYQKGLRRLEEDQRFSSLLQGRGTEGPDYLG